MSWENRAAVLTFIVLYREQPFDKNGL
jgi:hypothetical protein